jgi:hypothetical protein
MNLGTSKNRTPLVVIAGALALAMMLVIGWFSAATELSSDTASKGTVAKNANGKMTSKIVGTALHKALAPFTQKARVTGSKTTRKSKGTSRDDIAEIRAWARTQGHEVAERGRVPKKVRDAYDTRHRGAAA